MHTRRIVVESTATNGRSITIDTILADVDVLAIPTERRLPYPISEAEELMGRGDANELRAGTTDNNAGVFDLTGQPAISVPAGRSPSGLPIGLTFVARQWDEPTLLRAARAYEQLRGGFPMPTL